MLIAKAILQPCHNLMILYFKTSIYFNFFSNLLSW